MTLHCSYSCWIIPRKRATSDACATRHVASVLRRTHARFIVASVQRYVLIRRTLPRSAVVSSDVTTCNRYWGFCRFCLRGWLNTPFLSRSFLFRRLSPRNFVVNKIATQLCCVLSARVVHFSDLANELIGGRCLLHAYILYKDPSDLLEAERSLRPTLRRRLARVCRTRYLVYACAQLFVTFNRRFPDVARASFFRKNWRTPLKHTCNVTLAVVDSIKERCLQWIGRVLWSGFRGGNILGLGLGSVSFLSRPIHCKHLSLINWINNGWRYVVNIHTCQRHNFWIRFTSVTCRAAIWFGSVLMYVGFRLFRFGSSNACIHNVNFGIFFSTTNIKQ